MNNRTFKPHNKNACRGCWQLVDGKCIKCPGHWCHILHDYNPEPPVIPEAMMEEVQLR